jgi:predicted dehydrogenase
MTRVRWGILSTANIGTSKVIPAMQRGEHCEIAAIASRSLDKAQAAARQLGIPRAYGTYADLLADPQLDAIYNPLPTHLHVPGSINALDAGKHVLCEKPIGLTAADGRQLLEAAARHPQLKIMEAFMYRLHPQWQKARQLVVDGKIGELRTIQTFFSYYLLDPTNVRNMADIGGGGLLDIGAIASRWRASSAAPNRSASSASWVRPRNQDRPPGVRYSGFRATLRPSPAPLNDTFPAGQHIRYRGPRRDRDPSMLQTTGRTNCSIPTAMIQPKSRSTRVINTLQGDQFSLAVLNNTPVPTPLEDAVANMDVIDRLIRSAKRGAWA